MGRPKINASLASSCDLFPLCFQMTKKIKKLEKETAMYRSRWESSNKALLEMAEEVTQLLVSTSPPDSLQTINSGSIADPGFQYYRMFIFYLREKLKEPAAAVF